MTSHLARTALALAVATLGRSAGGQATTPCDAFCHSQRAERSAATGNFEQYKTHVRAVAALAPSHPGAVYAMARAFVRTGSPDSAAAWLARLARMGDTRDPDADSVFRPLRARRDYADARTRLLSNRLPILDGTIAFEIADPDFLPEGLTYDSTNARFLAGSLTHRAVTAFAPNGSASPFVAHAPDMLRVVGIHVDAARARVWFATWAPDSAHRADSAEAPSRTRLFLADLGTGRVVRSWTVNGGRPGHLLNDLVVLGDGSLFLTDTEDGSIYRLRSPADSLERFLQPDPARFSTANGITSTPDGRTLYVAYLEGVARVDVPTRSIELVPSPDSVSTAAIDGLYWYRGGLVAIQHIPTLERVVQYALSSDGRRIVDGAVRERGLPIVHEPTTGVIVGSRFYYIANSQFSRLDDHDVLASQSGTARRTIVRVITLQP
jgi:sugar lactone lactonase YvrE